LKAIFFMVPGGAGQAAPSGQKVRVTLADGRQVVGFSTDFRNEAPGFFLVPADVRTNTSRVYLFRSAVDLITHESARSVQVAVGVVAGVSVLDDQLEVRRPGFQLPAKAPGLKAQQKGARGTQTQVTEGQRDGEGVGQHPKPTRKCGVEDHEEYTNTGEEV